MFDMFIMFHYEWWNTNNHKEYLLIKQLQIHMHACHIREPNKTWWILNKIKFK